MVRLYDTHSIRGQIDDLLAEARGLNELAEQEERDLTADEESRFAAILDEVGTDEGDEPTGLHAQLARAERYENLVRKAAGGTRPTNDPQGSLAGNVHQVDRPRVSSRLPSLRAFQGSVNDVRAEERAYRFGQWALAAIYEQCPSVGRGFRANHEWVQQNIQSALTTTNDGQFLVPEEFGTDLIRLVESYGVARRLLMTVPMSSDTRTDPRRVGGLTAYFPAEGTAGTSSDMTLDNVRLTAKDAMVLTVISNQLSADAAISIGDMLLMELAQAFADKEDDCAFNGTGASTYAGIVGARTKLDALTAGTAPGLILAAGNAYSEVTLANFNSVVGGLPQYADTPNAAWVCHKTFYATVMQKLELAAGGVTAREISDGDRRPRPLFLGYPVEFSQKMPSTEANSQVCCLLGDFMQGARFGDRQQESIAFSDSATIDSVNVFAANQLAVRGTERFDINVHDVGSNTGAGPICGLELAGS